MPLDTNLENIELELFIMAVKQLTGYNLSHYARSSLLRRVKTQQDKLK